MQNKSKLKLKFKKGIVVKHKEIYYSMRYFFLLSAILLAVACDSKSKIEQEIEQIPIDLEISRFDKEFAAVNVDGLDELKKKYPLFFPEKYHDSVWINKIENDTLQWKINDEVINAFPSEEKLEDGLHSLFQHIKYYFPTFTTPLIYTATSDVDYNNKVIITDSLLIIALDNYLGSNHYFYEGIPRYISKNLKASQLEGDVASVYARQLISRPRNRTLLSQMIFFGKELYLKGLWLPNFSDAERIGFTEEEYKWAEDNEEDMWRYFIENELLFSTDAKLSARFINPAPFSKFYQEIDNESPGMTGRYIGWQIVRSYMKNNKINPAQLIVLDAEEIYRKSKYKPRR